MAEERLQKLLARAGHGSRRGIEELIRQGAVTVNGQVATLGDKADPEKDAVKVNGRRVDVGAPEGRYLLLHKPPAVMSTRSDPEGRPTVMELVPPAFRKGLKPVGRLDFMTSGLILMTNDGDLAQRVAHPRYGCKKTYEVKVKGHPPEAKLEKLRKGITIDGRRTAPAEIEERRLPRGAGSPETSWWTVNLSEGRTRQIREMFLRIGHPVQKLRRVAIGPVRDDGLPMGACRELTPKEVELLRTAGKRKPAKARQRAGGSGVGEKGNREGKPGRRRKGQAARGKSSKARDSKARDSKTRDSKLRDSKARDPKVRDPKARDPKARDEKRGRGGPKGEASRGGPARGGAKGRASKTAPVKTGASRSGPSGSGKPSSESPKPGRSKPRGAGSGQGRPSQKGGGPKHGRGGRGAGKGGRGRS